jgi:uncharacterized membrane protein required for colicin V production
MEMHAFDIIFGVLALILVFLGIRRGFIEEVMRLAAIVIGFIGALTFYRQLIPKLSFLALSTHVAMIISFVIIFFCFAVGIVCIGKLLKKMIKLTMMGWLDRLFGACLGGLKAFFVGWIFVIIVSSTPVAAAHNFFKGSRTYAFFEAISPALKTQALTAAASAKGALLPPNAIHDFWKKLTAVQPAADSLHGKEARKKKADLPVKEKK